VEGMRDIAGRSYDRSFDPIGPQRQLVAVLASGDRTRALRQVTVPTLVVHGAQDPMIGVSGGRATAEAIPGAELRIVEGMGHDLSRGVLLPLIEPITSHVAAAENRRGQAATE
jgi:pimeloyl-ACP methyl ester carboxylesterase